MSIARTMTSWVAALHVTMQHTTVLVAHCTQIISLSIGVHFVAVAVPSRPTSKQWKAGTAVGGSLLGLILFATLALLWWTRRKRIRHIKVSPSSTPDGVVLSMTEGLMTCSTAAIVLAPPRLVLPGYKHIYVHSSSARFASCLMHNPCFLVRTEQTERAHQGSGAERGA